MNERQKKKQQRNQIAWVQIPLSKQSTHILLFGKTVSLLLFRLSCMISTASIYLFEVRLLSLQTHQNRRSNEPNTHTNKHTCTFEIVCVCVHAHTILISLSTLMNHNSSLEVATSNDRTKHMDFNHFKLCIYTVTNVQRD